MLKSTATIPLPTPPTHSPHKLLCGHYLVVRSYLKDKIGEVYIRHTRKGAMYPDLVREKRNLVD